MRSARSLKLIYPVVAFAIVVFVIHVQWPQVIELEDVSSTTSDAKQGIRRAVNWFVDAVDLGL